MNHDSLWKAKLAARLHDPAEKSLVLLRDPAGHEGGTSKALWSLVSDGSLSDDLKPDIKKADWWASAADRPQWPMNEKIVEKQDGKSVSLMTGFWSQVHWTKEPTIVHPLTGRQFSLGSLRDTEIGEVKEASFDHHASILTALEHGCPEVTDRLISLALWRFAPEPIDKQNDAGLGQLWRLLPADTRVPDHSIWDHLDLTSAFAGAFAASDDKDVALMSLSLGPVQDFIAAARSTSDMWAGSHLLSRLAWETMKPLCELLGPEAILFPRLRGIAAVDVWLREEIGLPDALFAATGQDSWLTANTDANPLFTAALPNRFVAVVPTSQVKQIAERCERAARDWIQSIGEATVDRLLEAAGLASGTQQYCHEQMREQLADFPDIHWAAVPFSLIKDAAQSGQGLDVGELSSVLSNFLDASTDTDAGFLASPAWQVLQREIVWEDNTRFFSPNPGVLYPVIYDLAERVLAASKSTRGFKQSLQKGWRCSLTGETEWLTTDPAHLYLPKGQRGDTLWSKIQQRQKSWAKEGEYLGGLASIKRLWPTLFSEEVGSITGTETRRFVISTHTMALAGHLEDWLEHGAHTEPGLSEKLDSCAPVALPRRIMRRHGKSQDCIRDAKRIPSLLDSIDDDDSDNARDIEKLVKKTLGKTGSTEGESARLETYYGMLMFDGDHMGRILSGEQASTAITYLQSFHPRVQEGFKLKGLDHEMIRSYAEQKRPITANRHLSISNALNEFAQVVVPHIVETEHLGRVIYAGGDDVLAMLPTKDLLDVMARLRDAYSGQAVSELRENADTKGNALELENGFAMIKRGQTTRLMRMMGENATASCGAVIAHHQAPLSHVMRQLRSAEKRAKEAGGRDAFSISVIKRSGGDLHLEAKWGEEMTLLKETIGFLSMSGTSRRAVYNTTEWLKDLPEPNSDANRAMLCHLLGYQFARQSNEASWGDMPRQLATRLGSLAATKQDSKKWLFNFLSVAEFLARETRLGRSNQTSGN